MMAAAADNSTPPIGDNHRDGTDDLGDDVEKQSSPIEPTPSTKEPDEAPKKKAETWTNAQSAAFFEAIALYGRDFDKVRSKVASKNRDQIRHFYYRSVKRIKSMLSPLGLTVEQNNHDEELRIMNAYWELRKKLSKVEKSRTDTTSIRPDEKLHKAFPALLLELLQEGVTKCRKNKKNLTIVLPESSSKNDKKLQSSSDAKSPVKERRPELATGPIIPNPTDAAGRGFWKGVLQTDSVISYCATDEEFLCALLDKIEAQADCPDSVLARIEKCCRSCAENQEASAVTTKPSKRRRADGPRDTDSGAASPPDVESGDLKDDQHGRASPQTEGKNDRITLTLYPSNNAVKEILVKANREPHFSLSVPVKKPIPRFMNYLRLKFEGSTPSSSPCSIPGIEKMRILLDERSRSSVGESEGWGWDSTDKTIRDLMEHGQNGVVRLMYCWPTEQPTALRPEAQQQLQTRQPATVVQQHQQQQPRPPAQIQHHPSHMMQESQQHQSPAASAGIVADDNGHQALMQTTDDHDVGSFPHVLPDFSLHGPPDQGAHMLPPFSLDHSLAAPSNLFEPTNHGPSANAHGSKGQKRVHSDTDGNQFRVYEPVEPVTHLGGGSGFSRHDSLVNGVDSSRDDFGHGVAKAFWNMQNEDSVVFSQQFADLLPAESNGARRQMRAVSPTKRPRHDFTGLDDPESG